MIKGFPPSLRIRKPQQYKRTFHEGKRLFAPGCVLYYAENGLSHSRLGVVASKRQLPRAVMRNRGKRISREVFRLRQQDCLGWDLVLVLRKQVAQATNSELHQCLNSLFNRLIARCKKA